MLDSKKYPRDSDSVFRWRSAARCRKPAANNPSGSFVWDDDHKNFTNNGYYVVPLGTNGLPLANSLGNGNDCTLGEDFIRVHVTAPFTPITPLVSAFGSHTFDSSSQMQIP